MKFINNILKCLRVDRVEPTGGHVPYKKAVPLNVIDEMSVKYGTVDTSKDIDVLSKEVIKKRDELQLHHKSVPTSRSRCKSVDDDYNNREVELRGELEILIELHKKVVSVELNNFPLNKPCTIKYVADYIGVDDRSLIYDILTTENKTTILDYCDIDNYKVHVDTVSDLEVGITLRHKDWPRYDCDYRIHRDIYKMILPNWRFVKSTDSSIFYVERMA